MRAKIWVGAMVAAALWSVTASAQEFSGYKTNAPIEITADSLEVIQPQKQAIFRGNVIAKQGNINLRSDSMTVFYRAQEGQNADGNAISRIQVDGSVFLATPEESAKGSRGIYNVDTKKIDLMGDVILTRGQNVLKGSHLEYNLATGKSLLTGGVSGTGQTKDGRVRGLFVPKDANR